jgi:DNA polymerase-3 subunit alpha (Gram-positive type)
MILFDTETTGLIGNASLPLTEQPEIIEVACIRVDDETLEEVGRFDSFVRPSRLPLPAKITEITGITDEMLAGKPTFARVLPLLADFFLGERTLVAHNAAYDVGMMMLELRRLDRVNKFPWPIQHCCTVEMNMDIKGHRMKQGDLYTHVTGQPLQGAHRAMNDVEGLLAIVRWMRTQGKI